MIINKALELAFSVSFLYVSIAFVIYQWSFAGLALYIKKLL